MPYDKFWTALGSSLAFGLAGIILMILGFKLFDWVTPRIDFEKELAEKHNIAVAVVLAAVIIGISVIVAAIVSA